MFRCIVRSLPALILCLGLSAQTTSTGSLSGTVTDKTGAVVPGATVQITSKDTGAARETTTAGNGAYKFDLLPAGNYTVKISMAGFAAAQFENVGVAVAQTTTIDASLAPSSQAETVTVEATGAPIVDTERSDVSLPVTTRQVEDLPLNGRDFVNLAVLAPGAKPVDSYDPTKNRIGVFAVDGSNGRNVNVTVNGIDDKDSTVGGPVMQLPLEAVQEFLISTQRFSAANGRSEGAAVNVITKSGTNNYHGSLYFFDRNEALNANDYFSEKANQPKSPYSRQQFGGSIGGPVRKDKDFLFFALERTREQTNIVVDPDAYNELVLLQPFGAQPAHNIPTPYFDWRYNGRYDHRFNEKHSMFLTYSNQNNRGLNDQSGSTNDLTGGNFTTNQLILANLTLNSVLSPTVVNSFTAGYQYWNNLIDTNQKVPQLSFPGGIFIGTNTNVPQESFQRKWQFRDDLSMNRGKHNFKFGIDYVYEPNFGGFFESNPTLTLSFFDLPSVILNNKTLYPQGFATPGAIQSMADTSGNPYFILHGNMFGSYFQDDWKISRRLTLNLGLRYDHDFGLYGGQEQKTARAYEYLKTINSPFAGALPHEDNLDFSPRIGFAYDLTGTGKHVLRGGYGIYYGQIFENIPLFMVQQANPTIFATTVLSSNGPGDPTADIVPSTGLPLSQFRFTVDPLPAKPAPHTQLGVTDSSYIMDPKYRNPYTEQWNIGYAWNVTANSVIEADYVHVLSLHESRYIVINPKINGVRWTTAPLKAAGINYNGRIQDVESIGRSRYDGMNLSYRKRLSARFSLNTSYVLSRALGYQGSAAAFSNRPTDLLNIFASHDFGPVPTDTTHRAVISGIFELPWGIRFAPILQAESARPYNATQGISDVYGFGGGQGATHAVLLKSDPTNYLATKSYSTAQLQSCLAAGTCFQAPYDSLRGQPFIQFDLRASKEFRFGERARLEFIFQAFDVTNRANFGNNYVGNIRSSQFMQPNGFITPSGVIVPRSFSGELGAQFRF